MNTNTTFKNLHRGGAASTVKFFFVFACTVLIMSCSEKAKPKVDPIGVWENTTHWDNNHITLTMRADSLMLFKVEKSFCPGTKFFISVGKWHIEQDSFLVMDPITDTTKHYDIQELFPELVQTSVDSHNVMALGITAKLIMADSALFDITQDGKRVQEHMYKKTGEIKN